MLLFKLQKNPFELPDMEAKERLSTGPAADWSSAQAAAARKTDEPATPLVRVGASENDSWESSSVLSPAILEGFLLEGEF